MCIRDSLRFAQSETKHYSGAVKFGVATDSLDADGAIVDERPVPSLTRDSVDVASSALLGAQMQTPPMVSAIKIDGQRLHELARRGVEVERAPRAITVSAFTLTPTDDDAVWRFDVVCSVGTYVRVLLSDLAINLGTVGHLVELRRLASGSHSVDDALTLDELTDRARDGEDVLLPVSYTHLQNGAGELLGILAAVNIFIGMLNMLPMLPLDGGYVAIATYERLRSRRGVRYQADVNKLVPLVYAFMAVLLFLFATTLFLDIAHPIPF